MTPWRLSLLSFAIALGATPARADDKTAPRSTMDACATQAEDAQRERLVGRLVSARAKLIACANEACPRPIRTDCVHWLAEVERDTPSLVIRAVDLAARDLSNVSVFVDGKKMLDRLDGKPLALDTGEHLLRLEHQGAPDVTQRIVLRSGERGRVLDVVFEVGRQRPEKEREQAPPSPETSRVPPLLLGATGALLAGSGVTLWVLGTNEHGDLERSCGTTGTCSSDAIDDARTKLIVGDVAMLAGAVLIVSAVTWYLLLPSSPRRSAWSDVVVKGTRPFAF